MPRASTKARGCTRGALIPLLFDLRHRFEAAEVMGIAKLFVRNLNSTFGHAEPSKSEVAFVLDIPGPIHWVYACANASACIRGMERVPALEFSQIRCLGASAEFFVGRSCTW